MRSSDAIISVIVPILNEEINKLEAKIKELKAAREKEEKAVLTAEQKKRLEEILTGKDKDKDK